MGKLIAGWEPAGDMMGPLGERPQRTARDGAAGDAQAGLLPEAWTGRRRQVAEVASRQAAPGESVWIGCSRR